MHRKTQPLLLLVTLCAISSCSLAGYDNFALPRCDSDDDCTPINARNNIPETACNRFVCDESRTCVRRAQKPEVCDGVDNNCNGIVDENVLSIVTPTIQTLTTAAEHFRIARNDTLIHGIAVSPGPMTQYLRVSPMQTALPPQSVTPRTRVFGQDGNASPNWPSWRESPMKCSNGTNDRLDDCRFVDMAIAKTNTENLAFAVAIDTVNCAFGRLRIGVLNTTAGGAFFDSFGPLVVSNTFSVVDLISRTNPMHPNLECTGGSRTPIMPGVARPTVATAISTANNALATWIGASADRGRCGGPTASVESLGLSLESTSNVIGVFASNAPMGAPTPAVLGRTNGGGAVASLALATGGWITAFGNEMGQITARFVGPLAAVPSAVRPNEMTTFMTSRPTQPLMLGPAQTVASMNTGPADHLSLAHRMIGTTPVIALAWVESCGSPTGSVHLAQFSIDAAGTLTERSRATVATNVDPSHTSVIGLTDQVLDRGNSSVRENDRGGWLVSFVSGGTVFGVRVSSSTGQTVDSMPVALQTGVTAVRSGPALYSNPTTPTTLLWQTAAEGAVKLGAICGLPARTSSM